MNRSDNEYYRWKILTFQLEKEKELRFWAHSIGNVLKSGIVFLFQIGKLDFYVCTTIDIAQLYLSYGPQGSEGNPECIFFTLNTYQATSISDILWSNYRNWKFKVTDAVHTYSRWTDRHACWNSDVVL